MNAMKQTRQQDSRMIQQPSQEDKGLIEHTRRVKITKVQRRVERVASTTVCAHCSTCGRKVETLSKQQAADVLEVSEETLNRFIADGQVHAIHTISGTLRVCQDSLFTK
jgi:predicted site-specific integrase-resolvase